MTETTNCKSCNMTIESGDYCQHCSTQNGTLIPFEECLERFMQWTLRRAPDKTRDEARTESLAYMGSMPAWRDHPQVRAARGDG